jgi:hypothetical protein
MDLGTNTCAKSANVYGLGYKHLRKKRKCLWTWVQTLAQKAQMFRYLGTKKAAYFILNW